MNTHDWFYLGIFLTVIIGLSAGGGFLVHYAWAKGSAFFDRVRRWQRNGGEF